MTEFIFWLILVALTAAAAHKRRAAQAWLAPLLAVLISAALFAAERVTIDRGYGFLWAVLGVFAVMAGVYFLPRRDKQCPDCAEWVQPGAKLCRYCRHAFTT